MSGTKKKCFIPLTVSDNLTFVPFSLTKGSNKLESLTMASLSGLVKYLGIGLMTIQNIRVASKVHQGQTL